jgi:hypothetical protein
MRSQSKCVPRNVHTFAPPERVPTHKRPRRSSINTVTKSLDSERGLPASGRNSANSSGSGRCSASPPPAVPTHRRPLRSRSIEKV